MNQDQLEQIEHYASLLLTVSDIAMLMDFDEDWLREVVRLKTSPAAKAYYKGKLKTKVLLRESTLKFAIKGSPQAEQLTENYMLNQKRNEQ